MAESMHALGPQGKAVLDAKGFDVELSRTPPRQVEHMAGINDIRVAAEAYPARVAYFFAAWELLRLGWEHSVIPDAIWGLKCPERRVVVAVEYDRGTEPLDLLMRKFRSYEQGIGIDVDAVVLVADTVQRLDAVRRELQRQDSEIAVLGVVLADIRTAGIYGDVFQDLCSPDRQLTSVCGAI